VPDLSSVLTKLAKIFALSVILNIFDNSCLDMQIPDNTLCY